MSLIFKSNYSFIISFWGKKLSEKMWTMTVILCLRCNSALIVFSTTSFEPRAKGWIDLTLSYVWNWCSSSFYPILGSSYFVVHLKQLRQSLEFRVEARPSIGMCMHFVSCIVLSTSFNCPIPESAFVIPGILGILGLCAVGFYLPCFCLLIIIFHLQKSCQYHGFVKLKMNN